MAKRRERLERKLDQREEWAEKAAQRAEAASRDAHRMADAIPFGQPILVGHHSEKRDRRYRDRIGRKMDKACEERDKSRHHRAKAGGLADQLERSVFSDDDDAVERLQERIADLEATRERRKAQNRAWRKAGKPGIEPEHAGTWLQIFDGDEAAAVEVIRRIQLTPYHPMPWPPYSLQNLGSEIRRARTRIEQVRKRQARDRAAATSDAGVAIEAVSDQWVRVTFAERPDRDIRDALKAAGFRWGDGCWSGRRAALPDVVADMAASE